MKLLPWKELNGEQTRYRMICAGLSIITQLILVLAVTYCYVIPVTADWTVMMGSIDNNKWTNSTKFNPDTVPGSIISISMIGIVTPLLFIVWLSIRLYDVYEIIFTRLRFDIGVKP